MRRNIDGQVDVSSACAFESSKNSGFAALDNYYYCHYLEFVAVKTMTWLDCKCLANKEVGDIPHR